MGNKQNSFGTRAHNRINEQITGYGECRLIGSDEKQIGIVALNKAMELADEQGIDLVELTRDTEPPVCRLLDYSKYCYEQQKKAKRARKNFKTKTVKEIKIGCNIAENDLQVKLKKIKQFIQTGHTVRIVVMFRGREITHSKLGRELLNTILNELQSKVSVIQKPTLQGRNMSMVIVPS